MNEMSWKKIAKNKESGQALVEYVLILAIAVMLFLGLMNQFYKPFGDWMRDYMGAYLECLIDVGELPSLGYDGGTGECNLKFQPGTLADGRPPKDRLGGSQKNAGKKPGSGSDDGSASAGGGGSSASRRNSADSRGFQVGGPKGADGPGSSAANGTITERLPESQFFKTRGKPYAFNGESGRGKASGIAGVITVEDQKRKKREQKPFNSGKVEEDFGTDTGKAKKIVVKPNDRKIASQEEQPSWTFSEYLKYGVIILIVIALILFMGGQFLQISKSMEK